MYLFSLDVKNEGKIFYILRFNDTQNQVSVHEDNCKTWLRASGPLRIRMTNDYLFRALLQRNNYVLKGLVCAFLHLPYERVKTAAIANPVILGETVDEKTFFLDVFVTLNDYDRINLELQVLNEHNWPVRSLSYLCRSFDNLNSGEDYNDVRPAVQVGILDFTLFPDHPEFYSTYQFLNIKNHTIYSDKIQLSVLNLTRKDLAVEEDKKYHLDLWASFFKADTWEELKMIAKQDEFIDEACATVYQLSQEEKIRLQCEAREDYYRRQRTIQNDMDRKLRTIENQNTTIESQNTKIENQNATIESQNVKIENQNATIESQNVMIEKQNATIENQNVMIEKPNAVIKDQNKRIKWLEEKILSLQEEADSLKKLLSEHIM